MKNRKKILIADDDFYVHELLSHVLPADEFAVIHAFDGRQAEDSIRGERPDLVILDVMMPCRDGRDICRDLRRNNLGEEIMVLMLSARNEQFDRLLGLEVGADDYMIKPFSPSHVARKVRKLFQKQDDHPAER